MAHTRSVAASRVRQDFSSLRARARLGLSDAALAKLESVLRRLVPLLVVLFVLALAANRAHDLYADRMAALEQSETALHSWTMAVAYGAASAEATGGALAQGPMAPADRLLNLAER